MSFYFLSLYHIFKYIFGSLKIILKKKIEMMKMSFIFSNIFTIFKEKKECYKLKGQFYNMDRSIRKTKPYRTYK